MDLPTDSRGAHVIAVQEGSPAGKAGLRGSDGAGTSDGVEYPSGGDIIVGVDGEPMTGMTDLIFYLSGSTRPGDSVTLEVLRDGEVIELEVILAARP
jgi:S1-C subfamily serine protease